MASIDRTYHLPVNDVGSEASQIKEEVGTPVFTLRVATEVVTLFRTHDTVQSAISELWREYDTIWREMQAEVPTPDWHGTATDLDPLVRTHILRLAKGWKNESAVVRYLEQNDGLAREYGYDSIEEVEQDVSTASAARALIRVGLSEVGEDVLSDAESGRQTYVLEQESGF